MSKDLSHARPSKSAPARAPEKVALAISDAEIHAFCERFREAYGDRAEQEARRRRDRLFAKNDLEGYGVWRRILATFGSKTSSAEDTYN